YTYIHIYDTAIHEKKNVSCPFQFRVYDTLNLGCRRWRGAHFIRICWHRGEAQQTAAFVFGIPATGSASMR
ncbi:MAG: hypothetical protein ACK56F_01740, partial [bacterium]